MNFNSSKYIPEEFKIKIRNKRIIPFLEKKLEIALINEKFWSSTTIIFWILSTILLSVAGIFAFASAYYPKLPMGFISGILIVIGTACKDFTYFSTHLDRLKSNEINNIISNIGIDFQIYDESQAVTDLLSGINKPIDSNKTDFEYDNLDIEKTNNLNFDNPSFTHKI